MKSIDRLLVLFLAVGVWILVLQSTVATSSADTFSRGKILDLLNVLELRMGFLDHSCPAKGVLFGELSREQQRETKLANYREKESVSARNLEHAFKYHTHDLRDLSSIGSREFTRVDVYHNSLEVDCYHLPD